MAKLTPTIPFQNKAQKWGAGSALCNRSI